MSQAGLQPIRAGRFHVHTPTHPPDPERINFEIDAGLAFGTGQHATTSGCLDSARQARAGRRAVPEHRRHRHRHRPPRLRRAEAVAGGEVHRHRHRPDRDRRRARQCRDQRREARPRRGRTAAAGCRRDGLAPARRPRAVRPDHRQHPRRPADRARARFRDKRWRPAERSSSPDCSTARPTRCFAAYEKLNLPPKHPKRGRMAGTGPRNQVAPPSAIAAPRGLSSLKSRTAALFV